MAQSTCGNCGKPVDAAAITCPHCGVLLAAYASPAGSVTSAPTYTAPDYATPPPPVSAEEVPAPPPLELGDVEPPAWATDAGDSEVASSAPQPLFDTRLSVDAVATAADSDHDTELVTLGDTSVLRDPSVPDLTAEDAPPIVAPELEPDFGDEPIRPTWTVPDYARREQESAAPAPPQPQPEPVIAPEPEPEPEPGIQPEPELELPSEQAESTWPNQPVGQTEEYLRKLHERAGYDAPGDGPLTAAVDTKRATPAQRARNRQANQKARESARNRGKQHSGSGRKPTFMPALLLGFIAFMVWMNVLGRFFTGDVSLGLIIWGLALSFLTRVAWNVARHGSSNK